MVTDMRGLNHILPHLFIVAHIGQLTHNTTIIERADKGLVTKAYNVCSNGQRRSTKTITTLAGS